MRCESSGVRAQREVLGILYISVQVGLRRVGRPLVEALRLPHKGGGAVERNGGMEGL